MSKSEYLKQKSFLLCLIAKDQKEFLRAKRLKSKVRINSWSSCGVARAEFARAEGPTCIMPFISPDR